MDFALDQDQQLLRHAARTFLEERCPPATVRALWDDPRGESEGLWKDMAQLGWLGLSIGEAHGGSGLGLVERAVLLEEMGRLACPAPYLPTVLAADVIEQGAGETHRRRWLPAIAAGSARGSVALLDAELDWNPTATRTRATRTRQGWTLRGVKSFVPWAHVADLLIVPARSREGLGLFLVEPSTPGVVLAPAPAMDPAARWVTVRLDGARVAADAMVVPPGQAEPILATTLARGAVGASAEMLGAARRCLDLAVQYAKVREQFGQPIGAFQAIRHLCAEMLVRVENAWSATYYAAWALDAGAEDAHRAASVAKAYVSEAAQRVCSDAIQVHGGIGFTWEYDLHLYVKRAKGLEPLYGDADHHRELIVRDAVAER